MYRLCPEALRAVAKKHGDKTGYAIAKRTGLAESTISRLLRGQRQPGSNTLRVLSDKYGISVEELMPPAEPNEVGV